MAPLVVEHQALVKALLGDVAGARQALGQRPSSADPRLNTLTEAVLQLRAGDLEGARTRLGRFDAKQLAGTFGALGRALEGFCVAQLSGELRHVDRVALYGETGSGELASAWPELVAFVERAPPA
ncbi:MAG: hypothetical protein IAE78_28440 [Myxococcus sp.]|nr:hypothetical protein [Myxococcus sp.]